MPHLTVSTFDELQELIKRLSDAPVIAYDTEFISEEHYQPELCLVQIAAGGLLALVDPLTMKNLDPLWELFCDGKREIVVHACRSEMEFCHRAIGKMPSRLFDIQLAAGFVCNEYPSGYASLLDRFLHVKLHKAESRTIWNKRPLTALQVEYALGDVLHLESAAQALQKYLADRNRLDWYRSEIEMVKRRLQNDFETPRWRSLPKTAGFNPNELAILREVWFWRDGLAKKRNMPAAKVLRNDLVVELARRRTADEKRISAIRGMQRSDAARIVPEIAAAVHRALKLPTEKLPQKADSMSYPQYTVMVQVLYAALNSICKQNHIASLLVGGPNDVRELVAAELGTLPANMKPRLLEGWRAELVGTLLHDLLNGQKTIRLDRNTPDEPMVVQ
jgi:ribonuclease D